MTLAEILAETANPRSSARLDRERARWFAEMLRNAIAIARYDLRFYERYPEHACPALIARRVVRIAECEGAISILARVGEPGMRTTPRLAPSSRPSPASFASAPS
jgi:hypothetical protein